MSAMRLGVTSTTHPASSAACVDAANHTAYWRDVPLRNNYLDQAPRHRRLVERRDLLGLDLAELVARSHIVARGFQPFQYRPLLHAGPVSGQLQLNSHASALHKVLRM